MFEELEKYGENTICYTLNGKNIGDSNTSLCVTKANELCELDGGIELGRYQSNNVQPEEFKLHGRNLHFNIIYATPDTKFIGSELAKKYKSVLIMIF